MQIPQFTGEPLSAYRRITAEDSPFHLYRYLPDETIYPSDLDTINKLIEQGYEQITGNSENEIQLYRARLISQLFDVVNLESDNHLTYWAHRSSIEHITKYPVDLVFRLDDPTPENEDLQGLQQINMLQPLPIARLGEFAIVGEPSTGFKIYSYIDLPKEGVKVHLALQEAMIALAGGLHWYVFSDYHKASRSETEYAAYHDHLQSQPEKLASLEEAHAHVITLRQSWDRPDWLEQWQEVQKLAQKLAQYYSKEREKKPLPQIVDVFNQGSASIYNALPFHAFPAAAISRKATEKDGQWVGGDWVQEVGAMESDLILSYQFKETYVQIREEATDATRQQVLANMWKQSTMYSDLDSDVYLARLAQLMSGIKDEDGNTWITGQQILNYRGIKPKKNSGDTDEHYTGGHHWERLEEIAACMRRQKNITIKIAEMDIIDTPTPKRRRAGKRSISRESPLFMEGDVIYHNTLPLDGPSRSIPIAWQYRESSWMTPFLTGPNRYTTQLIKTVLNYDPKDQRWEKRLSKYFMWWLRANASHTTKPKLYIGTLLDELNLPLDERNPQRTRDRFEQAMNQLVEDHLLTWKYKEDFMLPSRKWLPTWLQQQIDVDDPPSLKVTHSTIEANANAIKAENRAQKQLERQRKAKKKTT